MAQHQVLDGSEQALDRYRRVKDTMPLPLAFDYQGRDHTYADLARVSELLMEVDTLEGRAIRAEVAERTALEVARHAYHEIRAVDLALNAEQAPVELSRSGRIRWLGDQARAACR